MFHIPSLSRFLYISRHRAKLGRPDIKICARKYIITLYYETATRPVVIRTYRYANTRLRFISIRYTNTYFINTTNKIKHVLFLLLILIFTIYNI